MKSSFILWVSLSIVGLLLVAWLVRRRPQPLKDTFSRDMVDIWTTGLVPVPIGQYQDLPNTQPKTTALRSYADIHHIVYINLDERADRRQKAENEFDRMGMRAERISAIKMKPGFLGCGLSHIKALETAKRNGWDHVLICEDDLSFTKRESVLRIQQRITAFLQKHQDWDVALLSTNLRTGEFVDETCVRVHKGTVATCYLVRREYFDVLLHNLKSGAHYFSYHLTKGDRYGNDVFWSSIQNRDVWYCILPLLVVQAADRSDILDIPVDYTKELLENLRKNMNQFPTDRYAFLLENLHT